MARRGPWRWALGTAVVAILLAMVTGGFVAGRYEAQLGRMARETARVKAQLLRQDAALHAELAVYQRVADLLRDPATRVVDLRGLGPSPGASGRVVWNERAGGRLATPGRAYQLWTFVERGARPAGPLTLDPAGRASRPVERAPGGPVKGFAVTLEPEGGVAAPTGPTVLASR